MTAANQGPGRARSTCAASRPREDGEQSSGATGSFPNVAVYLDEQSAQLPGPQLRHLCRRPRAHRGARGTRKAPCSARAPRRRDPLHHQQAEARHDGSAFNAGYGITAHGDPSSNLDATLNLPLIDDKLAVRAVIYNESRGGYIDNVPGTFTRSATDRGIIDYFGGRRARDQQRAINNDKIAGKRHQPGYVQGYSALSGSVSDQR